MMQGISGMRFPFCFNYQSVINKCFEIYDPFFDVSYFKAKYYMAYTPLCYNDYNS